MAKKLSMAADHGGYILKNYVKNHLLELGHEVTDFGTDTAESCDYADFARPACEAVQQGEADLALLFCSTGVGISIVANKMKGIRACCCSDTFSAEMTRRHNDANVLCLGGSVVGGGLALRIVDAFLAHEFEGGRHKRRIDKIAALEED